MPTQRPRQPRVATVPIDFALSSDIDAAQQSRDQQGRQNLLNA